MEARSHQGQPAVRVFIGYDGDLVALLWPKRKRIDLVGQNGDGTARYCLGSKTAPILPRTGQGGEQETGMHGPRIGSNAKDLGIV
jgi:hypothetical protein